jgi:membrane-bound lytic murein transglycosylase D
MMRAREAVRATLIGLLIATLSACATTRQVSEPPVLPVVAPTNQAPSAPEGDTKALPSAPNREVQSGPPDEPSEVPDFWERLVSGLRFADCGYDSAIDRELKRYTAGGRFSENLTPMLPRMAFVLDEVERRGIPTEFVLLPIIESHYRLLPATGNRPGGPWQMVPVTARSHGLAITADYDARQDLAASTRAALDHIEGLASRFDGDWTLVVKAYNAGEFRVRRAALGAEGKARFRGLAPVTLSYYAKLHALACIFKHPDRFGITLPSLASLPALQAFRVEADLDLDLAAAVARMTRAELLDLNPGFRKDRAPIGSYLVIPETAAARLTKGIERVPAAQRRDWHVRDASSEDWSKLAGTSGVDPAVVAAVNGSTAASIPRGTVLVPGRAAGDQTGPAPAGNYVVRAGDSPWKIARKFRVPLSDLLEMNGLDRRSLLRPGQKLLIP